MRYLLISVCLLFFLNGTLHGQDVDPSKWIEQTLFPHKAHYTLKDIAIPGSHDAGMSTLTEVGGMRSQTINDCNTLTQHLNIEEQLNAGIRMFDLRVGALFTQFYTKHSNADCMAESIGGGYGENLTKVFRSINYFLEENKKEFVILTFTHFCQAEASPSDILNELRESISEDKIYVASGKPLDQLPISDLAGKVMLLFEEVNLLDPQVIINSMTDSSELFINIKREYASTSRSKKLIQAEKLFFESIKGKVRSNDIIRLDWQVTQSPDAAALVCNSFENENGNLLVNATVLLFGLIKGYKSIRKMAKKANEKLPTSLDRWITNKTITANNKPNIIYVDMAGPWTTKLVVELNKLDIYNQANPVR